MSTKVMPESQKLSQNAVNVCFSVEMELKASQHCSSVPQKFDSPVCLWGSCKRRVENCKWRGFLFTTYFFQLYNFVRKELDSTTIKLTQCNKQPSSLLYNVKHLNVNICIIKKNSFYSSEIL
jgi:hypothetical protein